MPPSAGGDPYIPTPFPVFWPTFPGRVSQDFVYFLLEYPCRDNLLFLAKQPHNFEFSIGNEVVVCQIFSSEMEK